MDTRLFEVAWTGDVENLLKLIEDNPRLLHAVALNGGENPLHTACLAGHLDFVEAITNMMPDFARELNQDGFSPLHIASARGYVDIVKELVRVDPNLCQFQGKEGKIPLHYATIKGRIEVTRELLIKANLDSIDKLTTRGQTVLHLAVKNNQFESLHILIDRLKQVSKEAVLNLQDDQGNTILHLAVSRKQYEVVDLLLNEQVLPTGTMELNPLNRRGLAPLDILLLFPSEAGDREIEEILRKSSARRADELHSPSIESDTTSQNQVSSTGRHSRSSAKQLMDYFKYANVKDSPTKVRNTLLVIAILIATATYQAVLSPPGGVWQDDVKKAKKPHTAGEAVMGTNNRVSFSIFLVSNSIGFFTSLHMIQVLTAGFRMRMELQISMVALITTYDTCMTAIAPNTFFSHFFTGISIAILFLIPIITAAIRNCRNRRRGIVQPCTNQENV